MEQELIPVSDFFKLAALDLSGILPTRTEHSGRFWAFFPKEKAEKVLEAYDGGTLRVVARDFEAAITRTKNKIFDAERARTKSGGQDAASSR